MLSLLFFFPLKTWFVNDPCLNLENLVNTGTPQFMNIIQKRHWIPKKKIGSFPVIWTFCKIERIFFPLTLFLKQNDDRIQKQKFWLSLFNQNKITKQNNMNGILFIQKHQMKLLFQINFVIFFVHFKHFDRLFR